MTDIRPFRVAISDAAIDDLRELWVGPVTQTD
jgi:hypothetical protein